MLSILGRQQTACDGMSRRQLLQAGGAGLLGVTLPKLLAAEEMQPLKGRAKSVIFLFLFGGPSQLESFDMKPQAPSDIRGPWSPIASRTHGLKICELLPRTAGVSDKFCVIRNMSHRDNSHQGGSYYIQTGSPPPTPSSVIPRPNKDHPSLGSVVEYLSQRAQDQSRRTLPSYFVVPNYLGRLHVGGYWRFPGEYAGWLGRPYDPMTTVVDKKNEEDNPYYRDCTDEELTYQLQGQASRTVFTLDRMNRRHSLLEQFDAARRSANQVEAYQNFDQLQQQALAMVTAGKMNETLDIRSEPGKLRDQYGRNLFGQSTLMARRLVEAGVRFVTVHWDQVDGYNWDSHRSNYYLDRYLLPGLDRALSTLLIDLEDRGMLDDTLVVCLGEMGRTPKPDNAKWGRGHWCSLFPAILAGAGIRGGTLYGKSDRKAAYPLGNPTSPEDLAATIYHALGVDPEMQINDPLGRPIPLVTDGKPLLDLFG